MFGRRGRLFPFIAILQNQNDIANNRNQSQELDPCHSNHSLPGAWIDRRTNMYPLRYTHVLIILYFSWKVNIKNNIYYTQKRPHANARSLTFYPMRKLINLCTEVYPQDAQGIAAKQLHHFR